MRVSVFGLGYVGIVSGACLARHGHEVIGVDVSPVKVSLLKQGRSPLVEPGIVELISEVVESGRFAATEDARRTVLDTEVSLISVGTPSQSNWASDLTALVRACEGIGDALAEKAGSHTVVVRSTVPPGTTRQTVVPILEARSRRACGGGLAVCHNPELLREGSSVEDFEDPPYTILGEERPGAADAAAELYSFSRAPVHRCGLEEAEALKYASNAYHALKVAFANEVGALCKAKGIDGRAVMELVRRDTKLNASPAYLKPGSPFGGSCLPKDLRALVHLARADGVEVPLLEHVLPSNQAQLERTLSLVLETGERDVALFGLSFKSGTDDLRESPLVALAERLIGKGFRLRIYDRDVSLARLIGANRAYIEHQIPHIGELLTGDAVEALNGAAVAVVGNRDHCDLDALSRWAPGRTVIDLQAIPVEVARLAGRYAGVCW